MDKDIQYLLSLQAVRNNSRIVLAAAQRGELLHFDYDASRMNAVADFVTDVIRRDYGPDKFDQIPPHGRWQHFEAGGVPRIQNLLERWQAEGCHDATEQTKRLVDLFLVSVLLDAGAGNVWAVQEPIAGGASYGRSEGTGIASLYLFLSGELSSDKSKRDAVDGKGLVDLTEATFNKYFQITPDNQMPGVSTRVQLLNRVGASLLNLSEIFGPTGRPGNIVDYLIKSKSDSGTLDYELLWNSLQKLLIPCWPSNRTRVHGQPIGDAWPLKILEVEATKSNNVRPETTIAPFHKLTQWLAYSLMVPFTRLLDCKWVNGELGTGLPEYRNGGLFVDIPVLRLKPQGLEEGKKASGQELPEFQDTSDVIVEWRAMTVALLDELHRLIAAKFAAEGVQLTMAQMLEAGAWKSGRELAAKYRPNTKSSPILIAGDGTLF